MRLSAALFALHEVALELQALIERKVREPMFEEAIASANSQSIGESRR